MVWGTPIPNGWYALGVLLLLGGGGAVAYSGASHEEAVSATVAVKGRSELSPRAAKLRERTLRRARTHHHTHTHTPSARSFSFSQEAPPPSSSDTGAAAQQLAHSPSTHRRANSHGERRSLVAA